MQISNLITRVLPRKKEKKKSILVNCRINQENEASEPLSGIVFSLPLLWNFFFEKKKKWYTAEELKDVHIKTM